MEPKEAEAEDRARLEKMTMKQLREVAKNEGVCLGYYCSRKADAVIAIIEWKRFKGCYMERY